MPKSQPEADAIRTQRTMELLHALNAAAVSLQKSAHSESAVYRTFQEQITRLGLHGGISLLDETGQRMVIQVANHPGQSLASLEKLTGLKIEGYEFEPAAIDVYRQVLENQAAVFVSDCSAIISQMLPKEARPLAGRILEIMGAPPAIYVPVMVEGLLSGVLNVAGAGLTPQDVPAIQAFAHHLAVALDNARLFAALQQAKSQYLHKKTHQQARLLETARHLTASLDVKQVLTQIGFGAREILEAYGCAIYLLEADGQTLTPVVAIDPPYEEQILSAPLNLEASFTGQAIRAGKALIFNDAGVNDSGHQIPGTPVEEDERVIVAPFIADDQILGAMCLNRLGVSFTQEDLALAETFATYAATALKNAQTHRDLQREMEERIRAERELRESEEKYHNLVEAMNEGLGVTDLNSRFTYVNPAFVNMLGYSRHEMVGHHLTEFVAPDHKALMAKKIMQRHTGQDTRYEQYEMVWVSKTGRRVTTLISPKGLFDPDGRLIGGFGVLTDITERKRLEEQLRQSQKMEAVGLLAGGIAHDFNNLLTAINGFAELMRRQLEPDEPLYELTDKILNSGRRAADLVRQLLAFSRKQILEPQVLDLNHVVSRLESMLRRVISEDIELETRLAPDLWPVQVDPTQIEQVVINLAVNARDAMPTGGTLTIETANLTLDGAAITSQQLEAKPGDYARLIVRDTGMGISETVQTRIFEPFFTTKEVGQGTGLGLATVYGIVKQSGGHIQVSSRPGQGATFTVYLPRADGELAPSPLQKGLSHLPRGTETILIVEDNPDVRDLLVRTLRPQGYSILEAGDGVEALRLAEAHRGEIHLLLSDVVMPNMSGNLLAERLADIRPQAKTLFTTGYAEDAIAHYGLLHPDIPLLQKPFAAQTLLCKVREVLDGR